VIYIIDVDYLEVLLFRSVYTRFP